MVMFVPAVERPQLHCHAGVSNIRYCSNYPKDAEAQLEAFYGNRTLTCNMNCQMAPDMWDIVCQHWLKASPTSDCQANRTKTTIQFSTYINMPGLIEESQNNVKCLNFLIPHDQGTIDSRNVTLYCPKDKPMFQSSCQMDCNDKFFRELLPDSTVINTSSAVALPEFWFFFGLLIISWVGMAVVVSIGDAICFGILGDRHHLYGRQRLCGSLGWGIFALLAGLLVDTMSKEGSLDKNYTIVFWMTLIIMGFDMLASTKLKVSCLNYTEKAVALKGSSSPVSVAHPDAHVGQHIKGCGSNVSIDALHRLLPLVRGHWPGHRVDLELPLHLSGGAGEAVRQWHQLHQDAGGTGNEHSVLWRRTALLLHVRLDTEAHRPCECDEPGALWVWRALHIVFDAAESLVYTAH